LHQFDEESCQEGMTGKWRPHSNLMYFD
jgi:hypothetical protein